MKHTIPAIAVLFCLATGAQADPCKLVRETIVDMHPDGDGHVAIPVSINGQTVNFVIDTGSVVTAVSSETADKLGLPRHPQNHSAEVVFGGSPVTQYVMAERFMLGPLTAYRDNFAVLPIGVLSGTDGLLGADILAANDIDLDFANGKFSIFSQSHCYSGVVYWTHTGFAQIPIRSTDWHHIELDAAVDGQVLDAMMDTGAPLSVMSLEYAEQTFHIDPKSPDLKPVPENKSGRHYYRYPFKTLSLNGLTVNHPDIVLVPNGESDVLGGGARPKMLIGLSILSKLHLYIAYGEHNLYITPADAH